MPVTKKKGAVFAIYADTPERLATRASTSASASPERSPTRRSARASGSSSAPGSTSRSSAAPPRRALSALQPQPARVLKEPRKALGVTSSSAGGASSATKRRPKPAGFDIFVDDENRSSKGKAKQVTTPTSTSTSTSKASLKRPVPVEDKENRAPDSPASRTRSKVRAVGGPLSALPVGANDMGKPKPKPVDKSKKTSLRRRVVPDAPLADVSVAYGATGDEPEGFRDAPRGGSLRA